MGLQLDDELLAAFQIYYDELIEWNTRFNLTAITEYEQVQVRHFLDSLSCLSGLDDLDKTASCIDIGSGGGFPGLPLCLDKSRD